MGANWGKLAVAGFLCLASVGYCEDTEKMEARIKRVVDGDSIRVLDGLDREVEVQLEGIDAPELKQDFGKESSEALEKMLKGKNVKVTWTKKDNYGRILGQVYLGDVHVNAEMIKNGMAWHFKRYNKSEELAKLENDARAAKRGLWAKNNPTAPWDYRSENKTPDKPNNP